MQKLPQANGNIKFLHKGAKNAGDQVWVARYLAERNAEKWGVSIGYILNYQERNGWNAC